MVNSRYVPVNVWNTPSGIPSRISPTNNVCAFGAKKETNIKAMVANKEKIMVFR